MVKYAQDALSAEEVEMVDPWSSVTRQPNLFGEFQASESSHLIQGGWCLRNKVQG